MSIRLNIAGTVRQATHADTLLGAPLAYTDVTGGHVAYDYDRHGRLSHLRDGELSAELRYDALGRLRSQTARNPATGDALTTDVSYDDIGREVQRTLTDSAGAVVTLTQTWRANGQLASRSTLHDGVLVRDEAFTYDLRSRLVRHTADGSHLPQDTYGRDMTAQTFTYDPFNNLLRCVTSLADGTGDDATFLYGNPDDPDQLTAVTHTHPDYPALITLAYDANGRMTRDEAGRILEYDALGRLLSVRIDEDGAAGSYGYDALGRLTFQQPAGDDASRLFYRGDDLVNELRDDRATRLLRLGSDCLGVSADGSLTLTGTHAHDSPLWSRTAGEDEGTHHAWSAYGAGNAGDDLPGFNGERRDPVSGAYHLGNGYRAYSPALMRFTCPDSLSPFGAGGINPYAYCLGDPVNHTDPSGHVSNAGWVSIGLGIAGLIMTAGMAAPAIVAAGSVSAALASASAFALTVGTAGVISDVAAIASGAMDEGGPETSSVLGWVSLATGIAGMSAKTGIAAVSAFNKATGALRQRLGNIRTIGLSGKGAKFAARKNLQLDIKPFTQSPQIKDFLEQGIKYVHGTTSDSFEGLTKFRAILSMEEIDGTGWFHKSGLLSGERGYTVNYIYKNQPISKGVSLNFLKNYEDSLYYSSLGRREYSYPVLYGFGPDVLINPEILTHPVSIGGVNIDMLRAIYVPANNVVNAKIRLSALGKASSLVRPFL